VNKSACRLGSYDSFLHVGDVLQIHETHTKEGPKISGIVTKMYLKCLCKFETLVPFQALPL